MKADCGANKLTVIGKMDVVAVKQKLELKTKKKVELISPQPKKDAPAAAAAAPAAAEKKADEKKPEEKKAPEEKPKEVITNFFTKKNDAIRIIHMTPTF